ncbi:MOP flippase family protein [Algibacter sp.]|nr:MOP flippase family protein [Algibacter sp.]MDC1276987.1 MOP flippase family protein [Algibacter sp.]
MTFKKKAVSGVKWTTIGTIVIVAVSMLKLSILARFLDKSDFGLMALVNVILGFMRLFMDMGLTSAILHKQNITKNQYASLYWLNMVFSVFLYVVIIAIAPFFAEFYQDQELRNILIIMGLSLISSAIGRQFKTIEQKELRFKFISIVDIVTQIASLIVAIVLVLNNYGVYTLIYSALFQFFVSNFVFFIFGVKKYGLKLHFNYTETKPFLRIGVYQVSGQVVNYFNKSLDTLIIGKYFGTDILGGYNLAKQLVEKPIGLLNPILTKVATPVLAKLQSNKLALRDNYLKLMKLGSAISFLFYGGVIIFASPIVVILYGVEFQNIVTLVRILGVYMYLRSILNYSGSLITATGRTDLEFYWNIFALFSMPVAIYVGSFFGIYGVAWSLSLYMILTVYPFWYLLIKKMINVNFVDYLKFFIPNYKIIYREVFRKN